MKEEIKGRKVVVTEDGSSTVFDPATGETFHSVHGSTTESEHVYITNGLFSVLNGQQEISILEIGFGTGLNALLTLNALSDKGIRCDYVAIEKYPIAVEMAEKLYFNVPNTELFMKLHLAEWNEKSAITENFSIEKDEKDIVGSDFGISRFDLVYFDAFSPNVQPELWTETVFRSVYNALKPNGILVTYCVKGTVKQAFRTVGFEVHRLPGPPGKHQMLFAKKLSESAQRY